MIAELFVLQVLREHQEHKLLPFEWVISSQRRNLVEKGALGEP